MKRKPVVAIDIDDVVIATSPLVAAYHNKVYGTNVGLKDMYSRDLRPWGVADPATSIARIEVYLASEDFQNTPPMLEAVGALRRLGKDFELHAVTGRSTAIETATKDMLRKHFPDVFQSLVFTSMLDGKREKSDVCQQLKASVLIEDHLGHALPVAQCGIDVLLFGDYPWNQMDELPANVHRVKDWVAVLQYFDEQS